MTFAQLQTLVLSWLDDINAGYFTLPQINVWINNAQREVQKQLLQAGENWYLTTVSTTLIPNQDCYSLPTDFLKDHKIEVEISGTGNTSTRSIVQPNTPIQSNFVTVGPGTPYTYYLKKNCIIFKPVPSTAQKIYLHYSYRVADMTQPGEQPDVPPQYHEYIAIMATCDGFLKDQRDPSPFLEKKNTYLGLMKQDAQNRKIDQPRMIVTMQDDSDGLFY